MAPLLLEIGVMSVPVVAITGAFIGMLQGKNFGKKIVRIAAE
jgi:NADPH-dependent curcumin reductase CurA